jgi:catechol 2,3-dioxygenase-like lactoylglutathione lyase family enzyme
MQRQSVSESLDTLIGEYDRGLLTRRQLIAGLSGLVALAGGAGSMAAGDKPVPPTFRAVGLNHIALTVTDIRRSREFYVKHLGLTVTSESNSSCFLTAGGNFVALFRGERPGLHHYCYSIEDYSVGVAAQRLRMQGIESRTQGDRIYFDDPDGLEVQLSSPDHRA